jgi:acetoin utilization deacetylase AcuC-like enzyme
VTIAFISHPDCRRHDTGEMHPESAARLAAIQDQLIRSGRDVLLRHYEAPLAKREDLTRVHDPSYVDEIFSGAPRQGRVLLDPDTVMMEHSLAAALRAAGAVMYGVDLVMSGKAQAAFCAVRPPGHHAERARSMGFCIFNNIAVGAAHAIAQYGLKRIAIIDFDVHRGNGTEDIFASNGSVLFCSSFQHPFYPWGWEGTRAENIVDVPLAAGTDGKSFRRAIEEKWFPALDAFEPELLLVSAGFDAHVEDPLAGLALHEADFHWLTAELKRIAGRYAKGRIVSSLEGGYALSALGRSVVAHIDGLLSRNAGNNGGGNGE